MEAQTKYLGVRFLKANPRPNPFYTINDSDTEHDTNNGTLPIAVNSSWTWLLHIMI